MGYIEGVGRLHALRRLCTVVHPSERMPYHSYCSLRNNHICRIGKQLHYTDVDSIYSGTGRVHVPPHLCFCVGTMVELQSTPSLSPKDVVSRTLLSGEGKRLQVAVYGFFSLLTKFCYVCTYTA